MRAAPMMKTGTHGGEPHEATYLRLPVSTTSPRARDAVSNSPPLASSRSPPLSLLYQSFRRESTGRVRRPTGLRTPLGPTRD